jgi:hypothetical protein
MSGHDLFKAYKDKRYDSIWVIEWPEIPKIADEYTRKNFKKSGQATDKGRRKVRLEENRIDKNRKEHIKRRVSFDFDRALELFKSRIVKLKGPNAEKRFNEQIKNQADFDNLLASIDNYAKHLKETHWKKPKQSFETYLGTATSGYYWREFIEADSGKAAPKSTGIAEIRRRRKERDAAHNQRSV